MNKFRKAVLSAKLIVYMDTIKLLLCEINEVEHSEHTPIDTRRAKLKIITEEINKVGIEIDNVKKEITIHSNYNVN